MSGTIPAICNWRRARVASARPPLTHSFIWRAVLFFLAGRRYRARALWGGTSRATERPRHESTSPSPERLSHHFPIPVFGQQFSPLHVYVPHMKRLRMENGSVEDETPDLCDCESYDTQELTYGEEIEDGPGRKYHCSGCGFEGTVT